MGNNGKICVSVCAETADDMIGEIRRAEEFADVVEVRFDCLSKAEFNYEDHEAAAQVHSRIVVAGNETPLLTTFRPSSQGGNREVSDLERTNFWNSGTETEFADIERDQFDDSWYWLWGDRICSFHDFNGVPTDLLKIFDELYAPGEVDAPPEVIKIAVRTDDAVGSLGVWQLFSEAKKRKVGFIPIAMGEAGKWTRILGLAHGAFLTYASVGAGKETADGQITAKDMVEIYRVRDLDPATEVFGIVGDPVSQSLSPYFQNPAFVAARVNAVFIPLLVHDLDAFITRMVKPETREVELNFGGFSVTMPHKQVIMKHLDALDPTAEKIGAVNTVKIENGKLTGYNTDAHGFIAPLLAKYGDLKGANVAVYGAGGAARAVVYALTQVGAEVTVFPRDPEKAAAFAAEFGVDFATLNQRTTNDEPRTNADLIVDATPMGMKGALENESLFIAEDLTGVKFVYDLVTRPDDTPLIREAKRAGIPTLGGLEMLLAQGAMQFKIWTGREAPVEIMREALLSRMK